MSDGSMNNTNENIIPHAGNLFFALRASGYDNLAAIADLLDNSIDAKASNIRLYTDDDLKKIVLADDGIGMSSDTLQQAVKLGGKKNHSSAEDLGKYGLGLITASLSIGKKIIIITKEAGTSDYNTAVFDYERIQKENKFIADFHTSTDSERQVFNMRTKDASSGTVLTINDCDKFQFKTGSDFTKQLKESIRTVFRSFMRDKKKNIYINDTLINYNDPLWLDNADTIVYVDKDVEIPNIDGKLATMHIKAVTVPDFGQKSNRDLGFNMKNQGFYLMRNNREIQAGADYTVFKKHNDYNLLRIELSISSELDEAMNINFMKHDAKPNKVIIDKLSEELQDTLLKVRKVAKNKQQGRGKTIGGMGGGKPEKQTIAPQPTNSGGPMFSPTTPPQMLVESPVTTPTLPPAPKPVEAPYIAPSEIRTRFGEPGEPLLSVQMSNGVANLWYNGQNQYYKDHIIKDHNGASFKSELDCLLIAIVGSCEKNNIPQTDMIGIISGISNELEPEGNNEQDSSRND